MTEKQAAEWKQDAQDTLNKLDLDKHTKDTYMLYGASLAILGRDMLLGEISLSAPETVAQGENEAVRSDFVDISKIADEPTASKIDTLLTTLAADFQPYQEVKSEYIITPTDGNLAAVLDNLRVVLNDMRSLFSILWQSSGAKEEREEIRGFFKWYASKYNL